MSPAETAATLHELYAAALAAARPDEATAQAVRGLPLDRGARRWIIALGKAAHPMARAAVGALAARGMGFDGGLVVAHEPDPCAVPGLPASIGDHPIPGVLSFAAAEALDDVVQQVDAGDEVLVLLSGGASSLVASPVPGLGHEDVTRLFAMLLASGADIATMNAARKRFTRWGAGRLAAALAPARVYVLVVSDVPGDDLATIGSGPCYPDALAADALIALLERAALLAHLPGALRDHLYAVRRGTHAETAKPGDAIFATVSHHVVAGNAHAIAGAVARARAMGLVAERASDPLAGEASAYGARLAASLLRVRARQRAQQAHGHACLVWGGETTVTLGNGMSGRGGRSQELALAAARVLAEAGEAAEGIALLAAGTDGRDGPTDAAGAIVDGTTWTAIRAAGRDPAADLAGHDAYAALESVGALVRTGATGTNVMDVVIAMVGSDPSTAPATKD